MTRRSPLRDAHRPVDQMAHLRRHAGLFHESAGHVLEHRCQIEFLLIVPAERCPRLLAGDGHHRHVVHAGIVQAGDQMRGARPEVAMQTPSSPVNFA